jgi:hypothetical protein
MRYDLSQLPVSTLVTPVTAATTALVRLDERVGGSQLGEGWIARAHFHDAVSSLFVDGELVHVEDLVLHDAGMGIRAPTHAVTIAYDVLVSRRRIAAHPPGWAMSGEGFARLARTAGEGAEGSADAGPATAAAGANGSRQAAANADVDPLDAELAAMDAVLARSRAVLSGEALPERKPVPRDPLLYDAEWDEDDRLAVWRSVLTESEGLPPVLRAALLLDAWEQLQVFQHSAWLGRLLAAALLRAEGVTVWHLAAVNLGLRSQPFERRRHRDRTVRLKAILQGFVQAAESGFKELDRLKLARERLERKLVGRRSSSRLPGLVDLVLSRPMVSAGMIAAELGITPQAALKRAAELELRELTGRGRFRAWGIL